MSDVDEIIKEINSARVYSQNEIVRNKFIPWSNNVRTLRRIMENGALKHITIDETETGGKYNIKYQIKGSDLIAYLKKFETKNGKHN